jgi:hypothetical protein
MMWELPPKLPRQYTNQPAVGGIQSMLKLSRYFWVIGMVMSGQLTAAESPTEPRTVAAVIAADKAWGDAEKRGDADYVDKLLLPGYRSVGTDGKIATKAMIVDHARVRGASSAYAKEVDAWKAAHPEHPDVVIADNMAVLTWVAEQAPAGRVVSCDIFVYRDGRWHGIYSQHTTAIQ